jgi:hypothetical protein
MGSGCCVVTTGAWGAGGIVKVLVVMRLGSQALQQKRKILKITMQDRCMIDLRLVLPIFQRALQALS